MAHIAGADKHESDAASQLTHLPVANSTRNFNTAFPQQEPWQLRLLPCAVKHRMIKMVHTNRSPYDCPLPISRRTQPPGSNGTHYVHGCEFQRTSKSSRTPYHSSRFFRNGSGQESLLPITSPFRNKAWSNTSAPRGKYLQQWGPLTADSILWKALTIGWYNSLRPMQDKTPPPLESDPSPSKSCIVSTPLHTE